MTLAVLGAGAVRGWRWWRSSGERHKARFSKSSAYVAPTPSRGPTLGAGGRGGLSPLQSRIQAMRAFSPPRALEALDGAGEGEENKEDVLSEASFTSIGVVNFQEASPELRTPASMRTSSMRTSSMRTSPASSPPRSAHTHTHDSDDTASDPEDEPEVEHAVRWPVPTCFAAMCWRPSCSQLPPPPPRPSWSDYVRACPGEFQAAERSTIIARLE